MLARLRRLATNKYYFDVRKNLEKKNKVVFYFVPGNPQPIPKNFFLLRGVGLRFVANCIATP